MNNGLEPGKFYLHACPWDWTFVGRFVKVLNFQEILVDDAIYFTRTGATFDVLTTKGLVLTGDNKSLIHPIGMAIIPAQGPKIHWRAETPWVKK